MNSVQTEKTASSAPYPDPSVRRTVAYRNFTLQCRLGELNSSDTCNSNKTKKLGSWLLFSHYITSTLVRIWWFIVKIRCLGFFFKGGKNNTTSGTLTNNLSISCKERTITTVLLDIYIKVSLNNTF